MGDECVSIHVIRKLQKRKELADIEIIDAGTGRVQLLDFFLRQDLIISRSGQ